MTISLPRLVTAWVLCGILATGAVAQSDQPKANLEDLAWLAGSWSQTKNGTTTEEYWLPPKGGLMLGINRTTRNQGKTNFEFMRIEDQGKGLAYLAQPQGAKASEFPLKSLKGKEVVFENLSHDFPQRIIYRLNEKGQLVARIEGEIAGKARSMEWIWDKASASKP